MSEEQLSFSFESIPRGRGGDGDSGRPYDDNRVRLHPTAANPQGYIDASHITVRTRRLYIQSAFLYRVAPFLGGEFVSSIAAVSVFVSQRVA